MRTATTNHDETRTRFALCYKFRVGRFSAMHVDERLSALGHASGSAEVAAQALSAVRRLIAKKSLRPQQREALKQQAELIEVLAKTSPLDDAATRAAKLAQESPSTSRSLRSLRQRLAEKTDATALNDAGKILRHLAGAESPTASDIASAQTVAGLVKILLAAALDLVGSATQESVLPSSFDPSKP